jgi:hypothetical protein
LYLPFIVSQYRVSVLPFAEAQSVARSNPPVIASLGPDGLPIRASSISPTSLDQLRLVADATARRDIMKSSESGEISLATFAESVPNLAGAPDSLEEWNRLVRYAPTDYNEAADAEQYIAAQQGDRAQQETSHNKTKRAVFLRLLQILSGHAHFRMLVELVPDEELSGTKVLRLVKLLRGPKSQAKKELLNAVLSVWLMQLKPGAGEEKEEYQPNYITKMIRQVFKVLVDCCVDITNVDLRNMRNSYHEYLKFKWTSQAKKDSKFGRRPNRAAVEHEVEFKLRNNAKPPYDLDNYSDLFDRTLYGVADELKLRTGEVSAKYSVVVFFSFLTFFSIYTGS